MATFVEINVGFWPFNYNFGVKETRVVTLLDMLYDIDT
jgi:hypothetical protein